MENIVLQGYVNEAMAAVLLIRQYYNDVCLVCLYGNFPILSSNLPEMPTGIAQELMSRCLPDKQQY